MMFKKLIRTMGLYKAQFISMIIMISLGIGMFVGFNMEWKSIEINTEKFFSDTGFADYRIINQNGYSSESLNKIKNLKNVTDAGRYISVNAEVKEKSGDSLALTVTENKNVSSFLVTSGEKYNEKSEDGIWISDKYANANNIKIGDALTLNYKNTEFKCIVKGLAKSGEHLICVRDESQLMPDYNTYGFAYISPAFYKKTIGFEYYPQINVISDLSKKDFTKEAQKALNNTDLVLSKNETVSYSQANGEATEGKTMGTILPTLFLLIAVLTMATTMHRLVAKEKTQIGTLKALGFKNRRILIHYSSYAFSIGLLGTALGIALGYGVAYLIMNPNGMMGTYLDMPEWKLYMPWFCFIILPVIIAALTLIGFLSVKTMLKGTAADALRPYTPKKMKPMLIEKTKFFHKLSFGTRWNLRDIMRHKSRTAMSLIGILGCTVIMLGSLGMRDTMNAFLDMYYNQALKYESRIYLSEEATNEDIENLTKKYNGDWSGSVSCQIEDKTYSLDIYNVKHNLVRFPDNSTNMTKLTDNGAYVCNRIFNDYNLKIGDTFKISPYGTNKTYTLKVAGVIRSVSENIVITKGYADSIKVDYTPDSIYTTVKKDNIKSDNAIKNIQSKQKIIDSFETFTDLMDTMIYLLVFGAIILGVVVLYNLGVMSYTERYREMATLKVVGFRDKKIGNLLTGQNMWVTLIGVILGIPLGCLLLQYLLTSLAGEYEMKLVINAHSFIITALLTFGVSLLVSLMVSRKNKKINMVEALKFAE